MSFGPILLSALLISQTPYLVPLPSRSPVPVMTAPKPNVSSKSATALDQSRAEVLRLVNLERIKVTLPPLKQNVLLEKAAQAHAEDMVKRRFFSHISPEGKTPQDRIRATGYFGSATQTSFAENVGTNFSKPADIVAAWMKSPGHRANILTQNVQEAGVGFAGNKWVMVYGTAVVR